jgi:hypothetical protein
LTGEMKSGMAKNKSGRMTEAWSNPYQLVRLPVRGNG